MPIPLGILAAAGFRAAGGSYEHIQTYTLTDNNTSTVTFSSLSGYASTYQHLQIRLVARSGTASGTAADMRINGASGDVYRTHFLIGNGSSVSSSASSGPGTGTRAIVDIINISPNTSQGWQAAVIDILDPFEAKNKTVRKLGGRLANDQSITLIELISGLYMGTEAVDSLSLYARSQSFGTGSRFSLYGLKAS